MPMIDSRAIVSTTRQRLRLCFVLMLGASAPLGACGDDADSKTDDVDPSTDEGTAGDGAADAPTFSQIKVEVLEASCAGADTGCHSAEMPKKDLDLVTDPYGAIVDVMASSDDAGVLVDPGSPETSFLYLKLSEDVEIGRPMPPGMPLPADKVELVRAWIAAGAPDN